MKTLLLLSLLCSIPAFAETGKVIQTVTADLDGDGKPDQIQNVSYGLEKNSLEIKLSKSGELQVFKNIIANTDKESDSCGTMFENKLTGGKRSVVFFQLNGSRDACARETSVTIQIGMVAGVLQVVRATEGLDEYHPGDTSPFQNVVYDFSRKVVSVEAKDNHNHNPAPKAAEKMEKGCDSALTLSSFDKNGIPACLNRESYFMIQEIGGGEYAGQNACPTFDGEFECKHTDGNDYSEHYTVIRRGDKKVFTYDIRGFNNTLITDGLKRPLPYSDSRNSFQLTTCRRDIVSYHERSFEDLAKTDPRKPIYDKNPSEKKDIVIKQVDLDGEEFTINERVQIMEDNGTYREGHTSSMTCKKVSR